MSDAKPQDKPELDWEKIAKDNNLTIEDFIEELFKTTIGLMSAQMNDKKIDEISIDTDEFILTCYRTKPLKKQYNY